MDDDLEEIVPLNGDPNTVLLHSDTEYCFNLHDSPTRFAVKFVRWYEFEKKLSDEDKKYFENIRSLTKKDTYYTHGSMNAMKGYFYVEDEDQFLEVYARLWSKYQGIIDKRGLTHTGDPLFIVEKPTPVFRLFMDFDFKQRKEVTETGIEAVARVVHKVVSSFWKTESVVVCCSKYTKAEATDPDGTKVLLTKTGIHLHWPDVFTTTETLLHVRETILSELQNTFGMRTFPMNPWQDVFDMAPYNKNGKQGSGLRLLGSLKATPCSCLRQKEKSDCAKCQNLGYVVADGHGRPYMLWAVFTNDARDILKEQEYLANFPKLLKDVSIRYSGPPSPCTIPDGAPLFHEHAEKQKKRVTKYAKDVVHGDPAYEACELAIRSHHLYASVVVNDVCKKGTPPAYLVHVTGFQSRYCQNIRREHKSNRIWFYIDARGVTQKCHDDGESTEQHHGPCKDYSSASWPLPGDAAKVLFPNDDETCTTLVHKLSSHLETRKVIQDLVAYGDKLCKDLYGTSWSATLLFKDATLVKQYISGLEEYTIHYPEHLGKRHNTAMKTLGYAVAEQENLTDDTLPGIQSLAELEQELFSSFTDIVDYVCFCEVLNTSATYVHELLFKKRKVAS
jgi:hypothetical protein